MTRRSKPLFHDDPLRHPMLKGWLAGTTCSRPRVGRSVLFENAEYIVLKHNSHAEYVDRVIGVGTCAAYAELYRKADLAPDATGYNRNLFNGTGELHCWRGRVSLRQIVADCKALGIDFAEAKETP